MKCTNCGNEVNGKFCTECGAPAPVAEPQPQQSEQPVQSFEPQQQQFEQPVQSFEPQPQKFEQSAQPFEPQQQNNYAEPNTNNAYEQAQQQNFAQPQHQPYNQPQQTQYGQPQQNQYAPNQTSFGQQFSNQPNNGGYTGQQFSNQQNIPQKSGSGKTLAIVLSIVGGVILLIVALIIVFAVSCTNKAAQILNTNSVANSKSYSSSYPSYDDSSEDTTVFQDSTTGFEYELVDGGVAITGFDYWSYDFEENKSYEIKIPEKIDNKDVVELKELYLYSFYDTTYIKVIIPGSVKKIDSYAMSFLSCVDEIEIQDGVEEIGRSAFLGLTTVKKATVPASVTSMDECGFGIDLDTDYYTYDGFVMTVEKGSVAEQYCKDNEVEYETK